MSAVENSGGLVPAETGSDCTRWPSSGLCSLIDLEAILGRQYSCPQPSRYSPLPGFRLKSKAYIRLFPQAEG